MRILFDGTFWAPGKAPSGQHLIRDLVCTWAERFPTDDVDVVVARSQVESAQSELARFSHRARAFPTSRIRVPQALSSIATGTRRRGYDATITHNFASQRPSGLAVCVVHDVLFVDHPEWFSFLERRYLGFIRPLLRRADLIVMTSKSEEARIRELWPETGSRLRYGGLAGSRRVIDGPQRKPDLALPSRFVVAVGRINVRKNLERLIAAFELLDDECEANVALLIIGPPHGLSVDIGADNDRVVFTGFITDEELAWCYAHCEAFVFPSLGEGFGLPLVEAHAMGAPVICSDIPVFREPGLAIDYFDPRSVADVARSLREAIRHGRKTTTPTAVRSWTDVVESIRYAIDEEMST